MSPNAWNDRLATGDPLIDDQHAHLHAMVVDFGKAMGDGLDRQKLGSLLSHFLDAAAEHFGDEEDLMLRVNYPDRDRQHRLHAAFAAETTLMIKEYLSHSPLVEPEEILSHLQDWLISHVWEEDRLFAEYVTSQNREATVA